VNEVDPDFALQRIVRLNLKLSSINRIRRCRVSFDVTPMKHERVFHRFGRFDLEGLGERRSKDQHPAPIRHHHVRPAKQRGRASAPRFWEVSNRFLNTEMRKYLASETLCFAVVGGMSAWPILSMMRAIVELVK
jgi:hypothetical protein